MLRTGHKADKLRVADNPPEKLIITFPRTPFAQIS
jgi:hypothetical protein